jgi:hypothetical protein
MLVKRGVPAKADRLAIAQVISAVRGGRPVSGSFLMSRIPFPYRRYAFSGMHEMVITALRAGSFPEAAIMDPNYGWPDGKTGSPPTTIWMPYAVWTSAFLAANGWCVIPEKPKVIDVPSRSKYVRSFEAISSLNVRSGPGSEYTKISTIPAGATFKSTQLELKGGPYKAPSGQTRTDWLSYIRSGRVVWVARAFVRES